MGEADRRGTFEERKAQAIARQEEANRLAREKLQANAGRRVGIVGGGRNAGALAAILGLVLGADDRESRRRW